MKSLAIVLLMFGLQAMMGMASEEPIKKCSPARKFEGKFKLTMKMGTQAHQVPMATGTGTVHADDSIGKVAVFEEVVANGHTSDVSVYVSNNTTYIAISDLGVCQKKAMNIPILPGKVPQGATLHIKKGKVEGVPVQIWDFRLKPGMGRDHATVYMSEDECMLVKVEMTLMVSGQSVYVEENFYDMKEGRKDPSVFKLPKVCVKRTYSSYYGSTHRLPRSTNVHIQHAVARLEMHRQILV